MALRTKKFSFILGAVLIGLLTPLVLVEAGLRVYAQFAFRNSIENLLDTVPDDPERTAHYGELIRLVDNPRIAFRLKPHARARFVGAKVELNAHGFRDDPLEVPKPPGVFRIVALGDSSMFGFGVEREDTYIHRLETTLNRIGSDTRVEIVNTAAPAYTSVQEVELFHETLELIDPDAVLVQFDLNDPFPASFLYDHHLLTAPTLYLLHLRMILDGRFFEHEFWRTEGASIPDKYRPMKGWENLEKAWARLAQTCRERELPLAVIIPGWFSPPKNPDARRDWRYDAFRELCESLEIQTFETLPFIREFNRRNGLQVNDLALDPPRDLHPSTLGHAVVAKAVQPQLLDWIGPRIFSKSELETARELAAAESLYTEFGFHETEDWGGIPVRWTRRTAQALFRPEGGRLRVQYMVAHRAMSKDKPVTVSFCINDGEPRIRTHDASGYFVEYFDLPKTQNTETTFRLRIEVDRTFRELEDGGGRALGIAVYPFEFEGDQIAASENGIDADDNKKTRAEPPRRGED